MRIIIFFVIILCSCNNKGIEKPIGSKKIESPSSEIEASTNSESKLELSSNAIQKELRIDEVSQNENLEIILNKIVSELKDLGFQDLSNAENSPINQRVLKSSSYTKTSQKLRYSNANNKVITIFVYDYKSISGAVNTFNDLINHELRHAILKPGAVVMHHTSHIICTVGSCSMNRDEWEKFVNKLEIGIPKINCMCGGECDIIL